MSDHPQHIVRLTSMPTEREAAMIVAALEQNGITSTMSGQFTAGFRAEAPGWVQVLVAEEDLGRAEEVLAEIRGEQDDVDWSQVDVGQPEDTGETSTRDSRRRRMFWRRLFMMLAVVFVLVAVVGFSRNLIFALWQMARGLLS